MKKRLLTGLLATAIIIGVPVNAHAEWKKDDTGWWYSIGSSWATEWKFINNNWYYFDYHGYMKTGWIHDTSGKWYYLDPSGKMLSDIITPDGYVLNPDGSWNTSIPRQVGFKMADSGGTLGNVENNGNEIGISNNEQDTDEDLQSNSSSDSSKKKKRHSSSSSSSSSSSNNKTTDDSVKIETTTDDSAKVDPEKSRKPSEEGLEKTEIYTWFEENGNKYFKIDDNKYARGWLVIDLGVYYFDKNGVSQTEPFTVDGVTYYPEEENYGQVINNAPTIDTAIASGNFKNGYDPIKYKAPDDPTVEVYEYESTLNQINETIVRNIKGQDLDEKVKYDRETNTITIKKDRDFVITCFELRSPTEKYQAPAFTAYFNSEDSSIVETSLSLGFLDGYVNAVSPRIITKKVGTSKVTLIANNFKQTFNIVVTE